MLKHRFFFKLNKTGGEKKISEGQAWTKRAAGGLNKGLYGVDTGQKGRRKFRKKAGKGLARVERGRVGQKTKAQYGPTRPKIRHITLMIFRA